MTGTKPPLPTRRQWAWVLIAFTVAALVVTTAASALISAHTATQIRRTQVGNDRTFQLIRDCTTPDGDCYRRERRQTAGAVADINRVVILASACSVGLDRSLPVTARQTAIQTCVINRLAADPHSPPSATR